MISLVSFATRTGLSKKAMFCRQLTVQSINSFKQNPQRLLSASSITKINPICERQQPFNQMNVRTSSSAAPTHPGGHNHGKLWTMERYISIGLLAVVPAAFMVSHPVMDYLLALSLVTHVHWGIEAIVVDYIRPAIFGKLIPKLALASVYLLSILAVAGLFYFNYTDVGLSNAIRMLAKM